MNEVLGLLDLFIRALFSSAVRLLSLLSCATAAFYLLAPPVLPAYPSVGKAGTQNYTAFFLLYFYYC